MILNLRIKNFYSIADDTVIDFTVTKNNPKGSDYHDLRVSGYDRRASLINVIIGPNAAGKTNIIKALCTIKHLIADSQSDPEDAGIYYFYPNALHATEPSELTVDFSINRRIFKYYFKFTRQQILDETLTECSNESERFTEKKIFSRQWQSESNKYQVRFYQKNSIELQPKDLRDNASIISVAKQLPRYHFAQIIADYWKENVTSNITFANWSPEPTDKIKFLDQIIDNQQLRDNVEKILRQFDVGYNGISRKNIELGDKKINLYYAIHNYGDKKFATTWQDESDGTRRLIKILVQIAMTLSKKDGVVIMDDLDASMHPDLVGAIVDMIRDEDVNHSNTQFIFNTHDHRILSTLDKQQIFLTEKNALGETEIWRLDEVDGVRADDNYYTKYMAGAYAARPRII